eukprot:scaffold2641_cov79-Attheya_sp.AAC.1
MMKEFDVAQEARPTKDDMLTLCETTTTMHMRHSVTTSYLQSVVENVMKPNYSDDSDNIPCMRYSHEGSSARALIYSGWKKIGMERFQDLRKLVKQDRTTDDRLEFEILYLTKWQETSSKNRKYIRFRDNNHSNIENDLLEDLDAVVGV